MFHSHTNFISKIYQDLHYSFNGDDVGTFIVCQATHTALSSTSNHYIPYTTVCTNIHYRAHCTVRTSINYRTLNYPVQIPISIYIYYCPVQVSTIVHYFPDKYPLPYTVLSGQVSTTIHYTVQDKYPLPYTVRSRQVPIHYRTLYWPDKYPLPYTVLSCSSIHYHTLYCPVQLSTIVHCTVQYKYALPTQYTVQYKYPLPYTVRCRQVPIHYRTLYCPGQAFTTVHCR